MIRIITNVIRLNHSITIVNTFADRLRQARKLRRLTQAKLAARCGLSQSAIANYEIGFRLSTKKIFELARALQVSPLWLQEGGGPMQIESRPETDLSEYRVADKIPHAPLAGWPFERISPIQYWSLSEEDRKLIENTIAPLVHSLRHKPRKR